MPEESQRLCFVIGPIGNEGSDTRNAADFLLKLIIEPVVTSDEFNYKAVRADNIAEPGRITEQVINSILDADLVIADLSEKNPNAFYELGMRHMIGQKPIIHMARSGEELPFDIKDQRTIFFGISNPDELDAAKKSLTTHVRAVNEPDFEPMNPIIRASGIQQLRESTDDRDHIIANLSTELAVLRSEVANLSRSQSLSAFERPILGNSPGLFGKGTNTVTPGRFESVDLADPRANDFLDAYKAHELSDLEARKQEFIEALRKLRAVDDDPENDES